MAATVSNDAVTLVLKPARSITENFTGSARAASIDGGSSSGTMRKNSWKARLDSLRTTAGVFWTSSQASADRSYGRQKSTRRLRDSSTRAVKDARGGAAVKSRQSMGLSFSTLYFHVLERSWLFCAGVLAVVFTLALGMSALLCLAVGGFDDHQGSRTAPLRFAASHVFTMGFGTVQPRTDLSYALAVTQCFLGVLLNVFMFTFVITKFQRPLAAMLLADRVCLCTRAGEPFLLLRFANLRCNTLHRADVTLTLLRRRRTPEGEDFVARTRLGLHEPPSTLTAVATVAHRVETEGPGAVLQELLDRSITPEDLPDLLLQVVVTAYDPIYDADVCAVKVYGASDLALDSMYAGVMSTDEKGEAMVNFDAIHDVKPQKVKVFAPLPGNSPAPRMDAPAKRLELVLGGGRGSLGTADALFPDLGPQTAVEQICGYCSKLLMVVAEGGVDFSHRFADISNNSTKPEWLGSINPKKECPVARLPGQTSWIGGTDDIMDALAKTNAGVAEVMARRREDVTTEDEELLRTLFFSLLLAVVFSPDDLVEVAASKPGMGSFLLKGAGVYDPDKDPPPVKAPAAPSKDGEDSNGGAEYGDGMDQRTSVASGPTVRNAVKERVATILSTLERLLSGPHDYLCGDKPGKLDFWVFADLLTLTIDEVVEWYGVHGLEIRLGRNTRAWHARLRSMPHVRSSLGAGHSDGITAFVRTVVSKCITLSPTPGFPDKAASSKLLHRIMLSHPPAMLWSDVSSNNASPDDEGIAASDNSTAKLCV